MKKKEIFISVVLIVFILAMLGITIWYLLTHKVPVVDNSNNPSEIISPNENGEQSNINLPTTGNDTIITTNSKTSLRIINEYTTDFFTADKNLLIMFGSWCSHCAEELEDVEKILEYYKNNKSVNVILIAHEYEGTVADLITLVEQDVNFGNIEVFVDLKRVIRKTLDPEASTVPISYVVDKKGNVLKTHSSAITLDIAKDMLK